MLIILCKGSSDSNQSFRPWETEIDWPVVCRRLAFVFHSYPISVPQKIRSDPTARCPSAWMAIRSQSASACFNASYLGCVLNFFTNKNVRLSCDKFLQVWDDDSYGIGWMFLWDITAYHPVHTPRSESCIKYRHSDFTSIGSKSIQ